jgi:hypothetical protein
VLSFENCWGLFFVRWTRGAPDHVNHRSLRLLHDLWSWRSDDSLVQMLKPGKLADGCKAVSTQLRRFRLRKPRGWAQCCLYG